MDVIAVFVLKAHELHLVQNALGVVHDSLYLVLIHARQPTAQLLVVLTGGRMRPLHGADRGQLGLGKVGIALKGELGGHGEDGRLVEIAPNEVNPFTSWRHHV